MYNNVQKWNQKVAESHKIVQDICSLKLQELKNEELAQSNDELETLGAQLTSKVKELGNIVKKLNQVEGHMQALGKLDKSTDSISEVEMIPFQTYPLSKFAKMAEEIALMFNKQLSLRKLISEEICVLTEPAEVEAYESCWVYDCYIDKDTLDCYLSIIVNECELC